MGGNGWSASAAFDFSKLNREENQNISNTYTNNARNINKSNNSTNINIGGGMMPMSMSRGFGGFGDPWGGNGFGSSSFGGFGGFGGFGMPRGLGFSGFGGFGGNDDDGTELRLANGFRKANRGW